MEAGQSVRLVPVLEATPASLGSRSPERSLGGRLVGRNLPLVATGTPFRTLTSCGEMMLRLLLALARGGRGEVHHGGRWDPGGSLLLRWR